MITTIIGGIALAITIYLYIRLLKYLDGRNNSEEALLEESYNLLKGEKKSDNS